MVPIKYLKRPQSRLDIVLVATCLMLLSLPLKAQWVEAKGNAVILNGQIELARQHAKEDALRQAALQIGAIIEGHQEMSNGELTRDDVSVSTYAKARNVVVVSEDVTATRITMVINADMVKVKQQQCKPDTANGYKKEIALLGFSLESPIQANLGALYDIDRNLPAYLKERLNQRDRLVVHESSQYEMYEELANAPSRETGQRMITKAANYAEEMGVQFIVSGIVRDLSVVDSSTYGSSPWASAVRFVGMGDQTRHFAIEVFVHDGISGSVVFQKTYNISAQWDAAPNDQVGFASPAFWKTAYGKSVRGVLDTVVVELEETLRCQPFMTRITRAEGKVLHFSSGSSAGVRPGDQLAVYRTYRFYDSTLLAGTELTNARTALTVSQVHPGFATGSISVDAGRLNIQPDDLLIAW